eukprot:6193120-Pleurochrysis_carterae.AAC.2
MVVYTTYELGEAVRASPQHRDSATARCHSQTLRSRSGVPTLPPEPLSARLAFSSAISPDGLDSMWLQLGPGWLA